MDTKKESLQFKTNINCGGCINSVKPHLDNARGISHWKVDTENKDKVLTVDSDGITKEEVVAIVQKAGFKIEPISGS